MFRRWRERIERALERKEAERTPTRDDFDRLLSKMRDELIELRARIPRVEKQAQEAAVAAKGALRRAEQRRERAEKARMSGDADELSAAMAAVRRAVGEAEDLHRQAAELRAELAKLRQEAAEKMEALKTAQRNRDVLLARARRAGTAQRLEEMIRGPASGLSRLERLEDEIETEEDRIAAEREVDEAMSGRSAMPEAEWELEKLEAAEEQDEIERRLEELRREIREED